MKCHNNTFKTVKKFLVSWNIRYKQIITVIL